MKSFIKSFVLPLFVTLNLLIIPALATPFALTPRQDAEADSTNLTATTQGGGGGGQNCQHGKNSRQCWGRYNIDTNYYEVFPETRTTRTYYLSVQEGICSLDGVKRYCQTFNGTVPGPLIWAEWGDNVVIHVTNNMVTNGTAIHWHGLHMRGAVEYDGVPGVTQCPIAPGKTLTYKFRATQYGSTWYHSHLSLQYADGMLGPLILYGPSTANYDEDLGAMFLAEWYHNTAWSWWISSISRGIPVAPSNGLVNMTNTFDCSTTPGDPNCVGDGKKYVTTFQKGKKYLFRVINVSNNAHFRFSIDGHKLKIVAADLVPIKPYVTDSIAVAIGQRYDVIVEANAKPGDYWLRSGIECTFNDLSQVGRGIVRYDPRSTAEPTSNSSFPTPEETCGDEPLDKLVPHLKLDVTNPPTSVVPQDIDFDNSESTPWFQWTFQNSSLILNWSDPTLEKILDGHATFPRSYNVVKAERNRNNGKEWFVLVIKGDKASFPLDHPIHLHGHDMWILSQSNAPWDGTTRSFNYRNPPRRDTATLPGGGHLAIAFQLDNPGAWLVHCHIAWHASMGMGLEIVESQSRIRVDGRDHDVFRQICRAWDAAPATLKQQHDSGV